MNKIYAFIIIAFSFSLLSCSTGPKITEISNDNDNPVTFEISATDVSGNQTVQVTFDFDADTTTVNDKTFFVVPASSNDSSSVKKAVSSLDSSVCDASTAVSATVTSSSTGQCGNTFILTTDSALDSSTEYVVCLTDGISSCNPDADGLFFGAMEYFSGSAEGSSDTTSPTVLVSSAEDTLTATSPFSVTITFSEEVSGFELSDVSVTNGTAASLVETTANKVYTLEITPSGDPVDLAISVEEGVVTDAAGNNNEESNTFEIRYDSADLTATITSGEANPTNSNPIPITVTFSEEVTGFSLADLSVTNGTAGNLNSSANPVFTVDITPTGDGEVRVALPEGAASDEWSAVKSSQVATTYTITYDGTNPTIAITSAESTLTANSPFSVTITFSETVSNFVLGDVSVTNGTASNLVATTPNRIYTADITPSGDPTDVSVKVLAGVATDDAGNDNDASNTFSIRYDSSGLTVAITSLEDDPTNTSPFSVTVTFSEEVTGFTVDDIDVTNGTAGNFNSSANPVFTADITPTTDGSVSVDVDADVASDTLTGVKSNTAATTFSLTYDTDAPSVDSANPANATTYVSIASTVSVTFDEAMDTSTLTTNTANTTCSGSLQLSTVADNFGSCVRMQATPTASNGDKTFTITPSSNLTISTDYKLRVTTSVTDAAGNAMASTYTMADGFTTGDLGYLWIFNYDNDTVYKITLAASVGSWTRSTLFSWSGHSNLQVDDNYYAYLKGYSTSQVRKYNTAGGSLLASSASSYNISNSQTALADGYYFMFEDPSNIIIHVFDTADMSVVDASADANNYYTTSTPYGVGLAVIGSNVFVGGAGSMGFVDVYDWDSGTHTISADPQGQDVTLSGTSGTSGWIVDIVELDSGELLLVNSNDRLVEVGSFDDSTNVITITDSYQFASGDYPWRAAQGVDGTVYVLSESHNYIYVFDNFEVDGVSGGPTQTYTGSSSLNIQAMVQR